MSDSTISIRHESGYKFRLKCREHEIVADLPPASGGSDAGPTPPEYLAGALGSCIGVYVVDYCQRAGIPYEGMQIQLEWQDGKAPSRISEISVSVSLPQGVPEEHRAKLQRVAEACKVHNTLMNNPKVSISLS
ncbi:MAG: OsmC family protein [Armatimonadota bacterium]